MRVFRNAAGQRLGCPWCGRDDHLEHPVLPRTRNVLCTFCEGTFDPSAEGIVVQEAGRRYTDGFVVEGVESVCARCGAKLDEEGVCRSCGE